MWELLKPVFASGSILRLTPHPTYPLEANGVRIGKYTPDFEYFDTRGTHHVVETKGYMTAEASLRIRVFKALYPSVRFHLIRQTAWNAYKAGRVKKGGAAAKVVDSFLASLSPAP